MKKTINLLFLILCLFISLSISAAGDLYYIIHIKGTASNQRTNQLLKVGDQINTEDKIVFGSSDAVVVIMGAKGKYTLSPTGKSNNTSELTYLVSNALLPLKSNGHLSTRSADTKNVIDLKGYFGTGKFYIIGDKLKITLDSLKYPIDKEKIFIYRYVHDGVVVSKRIESQGNSIIIDKNTLYNSNGNLINPETVESVDIYYHNTKNKSSHKIVNFSPEFINSELLKQELLVQKNILVEEKKSKELINKELIVFLTDVYGKTDEATFNEWLNSNIND